MNDLRLVLKTPFALPHLLLFALSSKRKLVERDVARWTATKLVPAHHARSPLRAVLYCLAFYEEFRSLLYYRIPATRLFRILLPPAPALYLATPDIGAGLFLQHAFSTIVAAHSIGENCRINQQVTIGFNGDGNSPTIGNNVAIRAGAKVIGKVRIGDNCVIGANAVVVKDVPPNCVVVGVPAYIVRRDGVSVREAL